MSRFFCFLTAFVLVVQGSLRALEYESMCQKNDYLYEPREQMDIVTLRGEEILPFLEAIAALRIQIFREWPYFYEGDLETEKEYLTIYTNSRDAILVLAKEGERAVGVAMGLPINESMEQVQKVFNKEQMESIYYFADCILLKEYRKQKIGLKMIQDFEHAVQSLKTYKQIYFCEVVRDENDPRKPGNYKSLDPFWERLGYKVIPDWQIYFNWLDVGNRKKTAHLMRFRKKEL